MKGRLTLLSALALVLLSCGKEAAPAVTIVPQIVSTEVVPSSESVSLYASVAGPAHLTGCGFGIVRDGLIREYESVLDEKTMSFSLEADGLSPDSEYGFYAFLANGASRIQTPPRQFRTRQAQEPGPEPPTLHLIGADAIPGTRSVLLSATLSETSDVSAAGFALSADGVSYQTYPVTPAGKGISLTVEDLLPDTDYSFYAWAVQRESQVSSQPQGFRTQKEHPSASFLSVNAAPDVHSVILEARLSDGSSVEVCGFGLSREGRRAAEFGAELQGNRFSIQINDLQPETDYTWYAFFLLDGERVTSGFSHFRTPEDPTPSIYDLQAEAGVNQVELEAWVSHPESILSCGFAIAPEQGSFSRESATLQQDGHFALTLDDLQPQMTYRIYAWATTGDGEVLSQTHSFITRQAPHETIRFLGLQADASATAVDLTALLTRTDRIEDCGFGLSSNTHDFIEWSGWTDADGIHSSVSGLTPGTTYYFYAYFVLDGEIWQSTLSSFETESTP